MATIALCRGALRRHAAPLTLGLSASLFLVSRQPPMRLDAVSARPISQQPSSIIAESKSEGWLSPEFVKQLSGGSLTGQRLQKPSKRERSLARSAARDLDETLTSVFTGFLTGLLISVFSKTLVLVCGICIVAIQVRGNTPVVASSSDVSPSFLADHFAY